MMVLRYDCLCTDYVCCAFVLELLAKLPHWSLPYVDCEYF
jgi:hypothetical protein